MNITRSALKELCEEHIKHFRWMLSGQTRLAVNLSECVNYLNTWQNSLIALENDQPLSSAGQQEILDAAMSGDYNHILNIDEDANVDFSEVKIIE